MRVWIVIGLLLMALVASATGQDDKAKKVDGANDVKAKQSQTKKQTSQAPTWPRPYKPTEEISVDSTVPFPTDI